MGNSFLKTKQSAGINIFKTYVVQASHTKWQCSSEYQPEGWRWAHSFYVGVHSPWSLIEILKLYLEEIVTAKYHKVQLKQNTNTQSIRDHQANI